VSTNCFFLNFVFGRWGGGEAAAREPFWVRTCPEYPQNRILGGLHTLSGCCREKNNLLSVWGIKPQFLGGLAHNLITVLNEISWLLLLSSVPLLNTLRHSFLTFGIKNVTLLWSLHYWWEGTISMNLSYKNVKWMIWLTWWAFVLMMMNVWVPK
jgi:hypothetical protein